MFNLIGVLCLCVCVARSFTFPVDDYSVVVLNSYNEPYGGGLNGYKFGYELSDGQKRSEEGSFVKSRNGEDSLSVQGAYEYNSNGGEPFVVTYIANENGYQPRVGRVKTKSLAPFLGDVNTDGAGKIDLRFGQ